MQSLSETCVVHLVDNGDTEHNCADHQVVGYHVVDETPTSEPCPGIEACPDCQSVLEQLREES